MRTPHDELRTGLREAAEAYEPDRARILARVERGMAAGPEEKRARRRATRPPLLAWARVAGATAAVSGMLAMGGYALASVVTSDKSPADPTVSVSPLPTPSPDATSRAPIQPAPDPSGGNTQNERAEFDADALPDPEGLGHGGRPGGEGHRGRARCGRTARSTRRATTSGRRATSPSRRPSNSPRSPSS